MQRIIPDRLDRLRAGLAGPGLPPTSPFVDDEDGGADLYPFTHPAEIRFEDDDATSPLESVLKASFSNRR